MSPSLLDELPRGKYRTIIVDGNNNAMRFVKDPFAGFTTRKGRKTGIIYGVVQSLLIFRREYLVPGGEVLVCWDVGENLRRQESDTYKSDRPQEGREKIHEQFAYLRTAIPALGLGECVFLDGVEADDLVMTLLLERKMAWATTLLVSEDHDWEQFASQAVHLWKPRSKKKVTKTLGYDFAIFHALRGDSSDHVLVPTRKITDEDALEVAKVFTDIDDLLGHAKDNSDKPVFAAILENEKAIRENFGLVTVRYPRSEELVRVVGPEEWERVEENAERIFDELEFGDSIRKRWRKGVLGDRGA